MTTSDQGIALLKQFEGFLPRLYNDEGHNATIGYGHLVHLGPIDGTESDDYKLGISRSYAESLLKLDLANKAERFINMWVRVPLTQCQYDALACFVYNVGGTAFHGSHLLARLDGGDYAGTATEFARWNHVNGVVSANLTQRRTREAALFLAA